MRNNQHLRIRQPRAQHILDRLVRRVVEVRRRLVHDQKGRVAQLEQSAREREQLALPLA
jgi:hypothetical protein